MEIGEPYQQPAGTPDQDAPALKTSGYVAARTLVIMAPEDPPTAKTFVGSPLYFLSVYLTMLTSPVESPPPSWMSVTFEWQSQHRVSFVVLGYIRIKPSLSAYEGSFVMP